jgi:tripeptidyl-peptidase I
MPVKIAIRQRNLEHGHDMLMDISDPASPNFGKHMTSKEVADFFSPARESIIAIREWLAGAGIGTDRHTISTSRSWIKFDASVEELEELIQAEYYTFTHKETNQEHVACDEYHVPYTVHPHIDFITPTIRMAGVLKKRVTRSAEPLSPDYHHPKYLVLPKDAQSEAAGVDTDTCYAAVTPVCIQRMFYEHTHRLHLTNHRGIRHPKWLKCTTR